MESSEHTTPQQSSKNTLWTAAFFIAAGVIAAVLRFQELGAKGLWFDEARNSLASGLPISELMATLAREATPPFYYLCLASWASFFGNDEAGLRSLSVLFSLGGIVAIAFLAYRYFSPRVASLVTLLMAFNPLHIYYAQEAAMFSLLALLATLYLLCSLQYLTNKSRSALAGTVLLSTLMLLTHNAAIFFIIGSSAAVLFLYVLPLTFRDGKLVVHWLIAQAVALLCYLPWLLFVLDQPQMPGDIIESLARFWEGKSWLGHVMASMGSFTLGVYPPYLAMQSPLSAAPLLRIGAVLLIVWGLINKRTSIPLRFIAMTGLVALLMSLIYSQFGDPTNIPGRTDHALLPCALLLLALGIDSLKPRLAEVATMLVCIVGALAVLLSYYENPTKNQSRNYLRELRANLNPGDVVIATGSTWAETAYYLRRWTLPVALYSFPLGVEKQLGASHENAFLSNPAELEAQADELAKRCRKRLGPNNAIFVIYVAPAHMNEVIVQRLEQEFPVVVEVGKRRFQQGLLGDEVRVFNFWAAASPPASDTP